jgi:hypothetical protein
MSFLIITELLLYMKSRLIYDSSSSINANMDTSDHGLLQNFKDIGVIANGLTSTKNELVTCLFIYNCS